MNMTDQKVLYVVK